MGQPTRYHRSGEADLAEATEKLYSALRSCAEFGRAVPTISDMAAMLRVPASRVEVGYERLRRQGRIQWRIRRAAGFVALRIVTICETGQQTADIARMHAKREAKLRTPLDRTQYQQALTLLQRRFPLVYSAEVTEGAAGRGYVWVGGHRVTQAQAIDMAGVAQ